MLLRQGDGGLLAADPDLEPAAGGTDRKRALAKLPDQVKRWSRRLLARKPQRIRLHGRLDRGAHLRCGPEEAVGRGQSPERLVRTLEVVVLQEQPGAPLTVVKVGQHRARQPLLPQGLPEPLDLAAGLGMMRPAFDVMDALTPKLFLKARDPAPGGVLPPLIGQYLPRCPVVGNRTRQGFQHQLAPLVMRHHQAHHVAGIIIEKGRDVDTLMTPEQEREQV